MNKKLKSLTSLAKIRQSLRRRRKKVVFTNGCFDILHVGHVSYLRKAKACGDVLIVGLNRDSSVRRIKGRKRPIVAEGDRADVISELECVDYIVFFAEDTPRKVIEVLRPDVLIKGSDWSMNKIVGKDVLDKYGGTVKRIRLVKGKSTTSIIKKIQKL